MTELKNIKDELKNFIGQRIGDVMTYLDCGSITDYAGYTISFRTCTDLDQYKFVLSEHIYFGPYDGTDDYGCDYNSDAIVLDILGPDGSSIKSNVTICNTIKGLNKTLSPESQIPVGTLDQFKTIHQDNPNSTSFERFVADIKYGRHIFKNSTLIGYELHMNKNPKCISIYFDGCVVINHQSESCARLCARLCGDGHIRANYQNRSYIIERLILTAKAVMDDELPLQFPKGLVVNVLDGSGSYKTASKLGISQDFRPENLEWTTSSRNTIHGRKITTMYKLGLVKDGPVRFSANDTKLLQLLDLKNNAAVRNYWLQNY